MDEKIKNDQNKKFYRAEKRGQVGGVCVGLADYFEIDPVLVRLIFVLATLMGGPGIIAYIALWIVLPDEQKLYPERYDLDEKYVPGV